MKSLYLLAFVLFGISTQTQQPPCSFTDVAASIGSYNSGIRLDQFRNKFKALNDSQERLQITYSLSAFTKLLEIVNQKNALGKHIYDGLRAYFAVNQNVTTPPTQPDPEFGNMTIVFVPTKKDSSDGSHRDDLDNCQVIQENAAIPLPLPKDDASNWVKEFQQGGKYKKFNDDGVIQQKDPHYEETKSLWYDIRFLSDVKGGLLFYLGCAAADINNIHLKFGGFGRIPSEPQFEYHLTLLFGLEPKAKGKEKKEEEVNLSFTQERRHDDKYHNKPGMEPKDLFVKVKNDLHTDTGIPCPPPPQPDGKCPGALLPQ